MAEQKPPYGTDDNSYNAAGQIQGITKLVEAFYRNMDNLPQAKVIRNMHPADLSESIQKLAYFLSGWLGGPKLYAQHFGSIIIPTAHRHLPISEPERDAWLLCMSKAIEQQPYAPDFKVYLMQQLHVPAERISEVCQSPKL